MKKVFFVSLGCPKNLVDSEIMLGVLKDNGYEVITNAESADVIVINTCGFINEAKEESINTILEYAALKKSGLKTLIVTGCMVQRYKLELVKLLPEVDIFIGTNDYINIANYIKDYELSGKILFNADAPSFLPTGATERILASNQRSAYLKIAEGCKNHCTYCVIPMLRGDFRSRQEDDILQEAKRLAKNGIIEVNLIAQDVGSYGSDLSNGSNLAALLKKLCKVKGIKWLRLLYLHPKNVSDEVLEIIKNEEKIVKYIDMPIQHINTRILKLMNRHQTGRGVKDVIYKIKEKLPEVSLRTSLIVGFPTETEADFEELCDFVKEAKFSNLGVFKYSREEGTKAYDITGQIHHRTKKSRHDRILKIQAEISHNNNLKYLNKTLPVLVEGISEESEFLVKGRATFQAPDIDGCVYITEGEYKVGTIQDVTIYETHTYDLLGRIE